MRKYLIFAARAVLTIGVLLGDADTLSAQLDTTLSLYTGQSEITARRSITLADGFHIPAGQTVRIYTSANFQKCVPFLSTLSSNQNYISTKVFKRSGILTDADVNQSGRSVCEVNQTVQYFDGLGRPLQTVTVQGSPSFRDVVQPVAYDAFGREQFKYLPFAASLAVSNGSFKADAIGTQVAFYNAPGSANAPGVTTIPGVAFAETRFEASPLNRVLEQGSPGASWQLAAGHTQKLEYGTNNSTGFAVRLYNAEVVTTANHEHKRTLSGTGLYSANELYLTISKDENWEPGNVKAGTIEEYKDKEGRVVLKRTFSATETLSTYYVYDDFGNLSFVLPPGLNPDAEVVPTQTALNNFGYQYRYDGRRRLIEKKLPGKGWEYMVYNKLDQLVLSQDAVQRQAKQWLFSKYDALGRVVITGLYTNDTDSISVLQTTVNAQTTLSESRLETETGYNGKGYDNLAFPQVIADYHTLNYYDNYDFPGNSFGGPKATLGQVAAERTKGLMTGSSVNTLGTGTMLLSVNYYDQEGRVVQSKAVNHLGGTDVTDNSYNFAGELTESTRTHTGSSGGAATIIANRYEYDHMGRKIATLASINRSTEVVLNRLTYNEVGQLQKKELHSTDNGASFLQHTDYAYNERGWLSNSKSDQFSFNLKYADGTVPQYNGNIANQSWSTDANYSNVYTYRYDKLNRLLSGTSTGMSEVLTYDVMGNIVSLNRDDTGINKYSYIGNRLDKIESGPLTTGNYGYDMNGNSTTDGRNGVTIGYNVLNLPSTVTKPDLSVSYTYDATGNKLKKVSNKEPTSDYVNGIHYTGGAIEFIMTEEGKARNNAGTYIYEYNLMDHLGNVRYTFNRHPSTKLLQGLQTNNYYPFGKQVGGTAINKYLYNGKELQEELGQLDYGARFYDPVIGRWNVIDPKAELLEMSSPYVYSLNSPVNFIDKDGELPIYINGKTTNDNERGDAIYWSKQLLRTIASSGIPNPGGTPHFVDGNRYLYRLANDVRVKNCGLTEGQVAEGRREAGYRIGRQDFQKILSQLAKDPETGKITEKIQIYTHSRGAAFGAGYTEALLEMIKDNSGKFADANNVIDYVLNLAPHQSDDIDAPNGANSFSIDHNWDMLSGNDMGNNIGFTTNTASWSLGESHENKTFSREVGAFIQSFQNSNGNNNELIDDFVNRMKSYGIKVTVN